MEEINQMSVAGHGDLFGAMSAVQGEMKAALKDVTGQVGQQKTKYADLASCWESCRAALAKHGVAVIQIPSADGPKVTVRTILGHKGGQQIAGDLTMTATGGTPQQIGSAITYARRYGLCAMVGIAPEDDDGHAASERPQSAPARQTRPTPPRPAAATKPLTGDVQEIISTMVDKFSSLDVFKRLKAELIRKLGVEKGGQAYYGVLGKHGVEHADEFKSSKPTQACAAELIEMVEALQEETVGNI